MKPVRFLPAWLLSAACTLPLLAAEPPAGPAGLDRNPARLPTATRLLQRADADSQVQLHQQVFDWVEGAYAIRSAVLAPGDPPVLEVLQFVTNRLSCCLKEFHDLELLRRVQQMAEGGDDELRSAADEAVKKLAAHQAMVAARGPSKAPSELPQLPGLLPPGIISQPNPAGDLPAELDTEMKAALASGAQQIYPEVIAEQLRSAGELLGSKQFQDLAKQAMLQQEEVAKEQGLDPTSRAALKAAMQGMLDNNNRQIGRLTNLTGPEVIAMVSRGEDPFGAGNATRGPLLQATNLPNFSLTRQQAENIGRRVRQRAQAQGISVVRDAGIPLERWTEEQLKTWHELHDSGTPLSEMLADQARQNPLSVLPAGLTENPALIADAILNLKGLLQEAETRLHRALAATDEVEVAAWARGIRAAQAGLVERPVQPLNFGDPATRSAASIAAGIEAASHPQDLSSEERRLRRLAFSLPGLAGAGRLEWERLATKIPPDAALVDFAVVGLTHPQDKEVHNAYGALVLRREGGPRWLTLGWCAELDPVIGELGTQLARPARDGGADKVVAERLASLHDRLLRPCLEAAGAGVGQLLLVPDGQLHLVPFAALRGTNGFVAETYRVRLLGSPAALLQPLPAPPAARRVAIYANPRFGDQMPLARIAAEAGDFFTSLFRGDQAFGDLAPLPGTRVEADRVREAFAVDPQSRVETHVEGEATEAAVRQEIRPYVLHLGTHGLVRSVPASTLGRVHKVSVVSMPLERWSAHFPLYAGGVALTGANRSKRSWAEGKPLVPESDGILLAAELAGLRLDGTRLVTLSACDSGRGEVVAGEGILGLRSALLATGAANVLLALWKVEDAYAPEFMAAFYREFVRHQDAGLALATVQRQELTRLIGTAGLHAAVRRAGSFAVTQNGL